MSNLNAMMKKLLNNLEIPRLNNENSRTCKRNTPVRLPKPTRKQTSQTCKTIRPVYPRRRPPVPPVFTGLPQRSPPLNPTNAALVKALQNFVKKDLEPKTTLKFKRLLNRL